jgi:hypothetical protein
LLTNAQVIDHRLAWMARDNPNKVCTRIYHGDLVTAAAALDRQGMRIVEVARLMRNGIDFAFGRGA